MPAPVGADMKSAILAKLGSEKTGTGPHQIFLTALTNEISTKWTQWMLSMAWGGNNVSGAGSGVFQGVGSGGAIHATPFTISTDAVFQAVNFKAQTPATKKFLDALGTVLSNKFDTWAGSFKFVQDLYSGSSGSSPSSPGPFSATNVPSPLVSLGSGINPTGIKDAWADIIQAPPDPVFRLSDPIVFTGLFMLAVSSTIEEQFVQVFLAQSIGSGDIVTGTASPGAGTGSGKSQATGKIV